MITNLSGYIKRVITLRYNPDLRSIGRHNPAIFYFLLIKLSMITEQYIKDYRDKLNKIAKSFDLDKQKIIVEELSIKVSAPDFWNDFENCKMESSKYKTKTEFAKNNISAYRSAVRNKWINKVAVSMLTVYLLTDGGHLSEVLYGWAGLVAQNFSEGIVLLLFLIKKVSWSRIMIKICRIILY